MCVLCLKGDSAPVRDEKNRRRDLRGGGAPMVYFEENITALTGVFSVPPPPTKYTGQSVFLWFGVEWLGGDYGVLQPVLMFGPDCCAKNGVGPGEDPDYSTDPYWYLSAQYVFPEVDGGAYFCECAEGNQTFRVRPGDIVNSTMKFDKVQDTWMVFTSASSLTAPFRQSSTLLVEHPLNDPSLSFNQLQREHETWGMAVVEVYDVENAGVQMPQAIWNTTGFVLQAQADDGILHIPDWRESSNPNLNATCNEAATCHFDLTQWHA